MPTSRQLVDVFVYVCVLVRVFVCLGSWVAVVRLNYFTYANDAHSNVLTFHLHVHHSIHSHTHTPLECLTRAYGRHRRRRCESELK